MIEAVIKPAIVLRVNQLCEDHVMMVHYVAMHLYLGREEYDELRALTENSSLYGSCGALPPLVNYPQGAYKFLGKAVFVLKDIQSHLAVA